MDAFVALGGNPDRTGFVDNGRLVHVVRDEFGMTVKIDVSTRHSPPTPPSQRLVDELDKDRDGKISYSEFQSLFM